MNLTNHFLIAMPGLEDPNFHRTVTYVCAHNKDGAMGIVVNRPMDLSLGEVLQHMDLSIERPEVAARPVLEGGPVQRERGFVLHSPAGEWDAVLEVDGGIGIATSRDILAALAEGHGPARAIVALGYAGWAAGQLEDEVLANAWRSGPADQSIVFDLPYETRWEAAARLLGVDVERLSAHAGHA